MAGSDLAGPDSGSPGAHWPEVPAGGDSPAPVGPPPDSSPRRAADGELLGRAEALELVDMLLAGLGTSGAAWMLRGEPGIGKTALLDKAAARAAAAGVCVLRVSGVEFEAEIGLSALHQLLFPLRHLVGGLPERQRTAIDQVLGQADGPYLDPLVVAAGALALLVTATRLQPLLLLVDDVSWIDGASATVLGFVARRITGHPVLFLTAARPSGGTVFDQIGLPELPVTPLPDEAAGVLLDSHHPGLAPAARERLLTDAAGNPLALRELPTLLTPAQRAGRDLMPPQLPMSARLQAAFAVRLRGLPAVTRALLLGAALEPVAELGTLLAVVRGEPCARGAGADGAGADGIGVDGAGVDGAEAAGPGRPAVAATVDDLAPAERAGLVRPDPSTGRVAFLHPLIRSAVVQMSSVPERRDAHRRLARELPVDSDRRPWHLAEAAVGQDERIAAALEESARRTARRGNAAEAIRILLRSVGLTPTPVDRARRLAEAAYHASNCGRLDMADELLADARRLHPAAAGVVAADDAGAALGPFVPPDSPGPAGPTDTQRPQAVVGAAGQPGYGPLWPADRAGAASRSTHGAATEAGLLAFRLGDVDTAHRLLGAALDAATVSAATATADGTAATATATAAADDWADETASMLLVVCAHGGRAELWETFAAARRRLPGVLGGLTLVCHDALGDPANTAHGARERLRELAAALPFDPVPRLVLRLCLAAQYVDALGEYADLCRRMVERERDGGAVVHVVGGLTFLCFDHYLRGRWDEAVADAGEGLALADAHGYQLFSSRFRYVLAAVAAARGDVTAAVARSDAITAWAQPRRLLAHLTLGSHIRALVSIGQGDYEEAYAHAARISPPGVLASYVPQALWTVGDLVEAAVRTGRLQEARAHVAVATAADLPAISPRLALLVAGARAQVAAAERSAAARTCYESALAAPRADQWPFDHARLLLGYGEWLRREREVTRARRPLHAALETFDRLGALPWAARARGELRAAGVTVPSPRHAVPAGGGVADHRPHTGRPESLTPHELQIAHLAATGLTNRQIGERLGVGHRGVSAHLYRIFPKLGITSRAALRDALAAHAVDAE
ncbi:MULTISPECIES: helix-turn-helix transcriptional regulator [Pseudofrankia]|uniref:helix-turn-helix transcriptional regulator n=1 Tax=Pseudofrankia TaxID=2994363 RepID=UPI0013014B84|nr:MULTISPECIES: LuxR family transcriptional regulator [Pseudofrankia]